LTLAGLFAATSSAVGKSRRGRVVLLIQTALIALSTFLVWHTTRTLAARQALPALNQQASWAILLLSWVLPAFAPKFALNRTVSVILGLAAPYVLLSVTYDSFGA